MARPKTPPYTLGKITYGDHPTKPGHRQARGFYNDDNFKRIEVRASGKTDAAARRTLNAKVQSARGEHQGGDAVLNQSTKVPIAAAVWLDVKERENLAVRTLRDYRGYVRNSINSGPLAHLTLAQVNDVARIEAWLTTIADGRGNEAAKQSRKVLKGTLDLAERRGAIKANVMGRVKTPRAKPGSVGDRKCKDEDCDYDCGKRHLATDRAFTPEEMGRVLVAADSAKADVGDLAYFLFVTGVRINEALSCTSWADVDLDAKTVRVRGTKTKAADRTLGLGDELVKRLRQRAAIHGTAGLVFGITRYESKLGQPRDRDNVGKALRRVFANADVRWAGTHSFRRTVATWMDEQGQSLASIANQLGHADTNVTARYLGRKDVATNAASIMVLPPSAKPHLRAVQ